VKRVHTPMQKDYFEKLVGTIPVDNISKWKMNLLHDRLKN